MFLHQSLESSLRALIYKYFFQRAGFEVLGADNVILVRSFLEAVGANRVCAREQIGQIERGAKPVGAESTLKIINMECFHGR